MMKKLLVLMLVLGMASVANAGWVELSVNGDPDPGVITLVPSEEITLDVHLSDGLFDGGDILIKVTGPGSLDYSALTFETMPFTNVWFPPAGDWYPYDRAWSGPWMYVPSLSDSKGVLITGGNIDWNVLPDPEDGKIVIMDGLIFHCDDPGEVTVELIAAGTMGLGWFLYDEEGVLTEMYRPYEQWDVIDTLTIVQIPEPMTVLLLGLGGLFLRRRK